MATGNSIPQLIAGENLLPYSAVRIAFDSGDFTVVACESEYFAICGITDGSVSAYNGQYHAMTGEPVTLQTGKAVLVRIRNEDIPSPQMSATTGLALFPVYGEKGAMAARPWQNDFPVEEPLFKNFHYIALQSVALQGDYSDQNNSIYWAMRVQDRLEYFI